MELSILMADLARRGGSDLHLVVGEPPIFRVRDGLVRSDGPVLSGQDVEEMTLPLLPENARAALAEGASDVEAGVDLSDQQGHVHIFRERGRLAVCIRRLDLTIPALDSICVGEGVGALFNRLIRSPHGLLLVTGPTGSGKTTTCFSMLDAVNRTNPVRIMTLEDPLTYRFENKLGVISQRRVGEDVGSFAGGLRSAINTDPDILYISEFRDLETAQLALSLAEMGHLIVAPLHADGAREAVTRFVEAFPEPVAMIRRSLARNLVAVIAQRLLPRSDRPGRVPVYEILLANARVREMITEGRDDLDLAIEAGRAEGMRTMDDSVLECFRRGFIDYETARREMTDRERLDRRPETA